MLLCYVYDLPMRPYCALTLFFLIHDYCSLSTGGNKRFREAVSSSLHKYMAAESRFEKSLVVHGIVGVVERAGGRFLKKDHKTGTWYELSRQQSKEKVGHAIRDAVNSYETRAKKKQQKHHERMSAETGYAAMPSSMERMSEGGGSHEKRTGVGVFDTDYSEGSRKRRRTASPPSMQQHPLPPSGVVGAGGLKQSPIAPPPIDTGLASHLPDSLSQSPIAQNPQQQQQPRFDYSGANAILGMVASLPSTLQPSPINDQQRRATTLDTEHHQRSDSQSIHLSASTGLHSPASGYGEEHKQQRDLPSTLPLPHHINTSGASGGISSQPQYLHPYAHLLHHPDPQLDPLDPVARMQLMQMQQQRDQYFLDHPETRGDDNDHFLEAINAVLGPLPDNGAAAAAEQQQQMPQRVATQQQHSHDDTSYLTADPTDPQHPNHPQHQLWLQQRMQREVLRRRQQEFHDEQQRRRSSKQQEPE